MDSEPGKLDRMTGQVCNRLHQIFDKIIESRSQRAEQLRPRRSVDTEAGGRVPDRVGHHSCATVVERVREVDLWPPPGQSMAFQQ
ncbi:MAG: hypothetical protein WKF83_12870 [Nocardioidaceae bacterium]